MLPKYTWALGHTEAVKQIFDFLNSQQSVIDEISKKEQERKRYAVGDDATYDEFRKGGE